MENNTSNTENENENKQTKNEIVTREKTKMAAKAQPKFYAVARGRQVGIFTTLAKCCKSVDGFSHNQYKGTERLEQAVEMLDLNGIHHSEIQEIQEEIKEEGQYIAETADIEERSDKVLQDISEETEVKQIEENEDK